MSTTTIRLFVVALMLAGTATYLRAVARPEVVPARTTLAAFPLVLDEWSGRNGPDLDEPTLRLLGVDDYLSRIYSLHGEPALSLYIGYYASQRKGDTIHSPMNCLPGAGWAPVTTERVTIDAADGTQVFANRVLIQKGEERQIALYWYQGRGRSVASEYASKALLVWDAATRHRTDGALIRVVSPIRPSDVTGEVADARARGFVARIAPQLSTFLPE